MARLLCLKYFTNASFDPAKSSPPRPSENLDFLWPDNQFGHKICPFFLHIES